jgi:hypothetical protein
MIYAKVIGSVLGSIWFVLLGVLSYFVYKTDKKFDINIVVKQILHLDSLRYGKKLLILVNLFRLITLLFIIFGFVWALS